ncbi:ABC transporter substrate-binding protein [Brachybacterium sp. Z12]|nr:ABC transporter substrate-binding protein [Brachybacterium sp. Z12]
MAPADMIPALDAGSIGGYTVADPFNAMAEMKQVGTIGRYLGDVWRSHPCCVTVGSGGLMQRPRSRSRRSPRRSCAPRSTAGRTAKGSPPNSPAPTSRSRRPRSPRPCTAPTPGTPMSNTPTGTARRSTSPPSCGPASPRSWSARCAPPCSTHRWALLPRSTPPTPMAWSSTTPPCGTPPAAWTPLPCPGSTIPR